MRNPQHVVLASLVAFSLILNLAYVLTADKKGKVSTRAGGYSDRLEEAKDLPPKIVLQFIDDNELGESFGVITTGNKRLTYNEKGSTNNTRIFIDGNDFLLAKPKEVSHTPAPSLKGFESGRAIWEFSKENLELIEVVQEVSLALGPITNRKDAIRIAYKITNMGNKKRSVGLRLMLDTYIGENDGVPFIMPGYKGLVSSGVRLKTNQIPDYIQALERSNLANPGTIVNINLTGAGATRPDQVIISAWDDRNPIDFPGEEEVPAEWDYFERLGGAGHPLRNRKGDPDSAIGIYYGPKDIHPGKSEDIVLFYGLGAVTAKGENLGLIGPTMANQREEFEIVVLAKGVNIPSQVRLRLSDGLEFARNEGSTKTIDSDPSHGRNFVPLSWRIKCKREASVEQVVEALLTPGGKKEKHTIMVRDGVIPSSTLSANFLWYIIIVEAIICGAALLYVAARGRR